MAEFASRGVGAAGLTTGIIGSALGVLNGGLGNALGGVMGGNASNCSDNMLVNRYEAGQSARIAELETEVKLRDANIYTNTHTDGKMLELYKYFDGKIDCINHKLTDQAVWNATQTGTISCMAGQIAQLQSLTRLVIPNGSVCPGWGEVTVTPTTTTTTTTT